MYKHTILIDQELFKVPFNVAGKIGVRCSCQVFKQRADVIAFYAHFFAQREGNAIVFLAK